MAKTRSKSKSSKKAKPAQKAIYIKLSESNPFDMELWAMMEACKADGDKINVSATAKMLLHRWYMQYRATGSMAAQLPSMLPALPAPNGNGNGHHKTPPEPEEDREDINDPRVKRLAAMTFDDFEF